MIRKIISGGQTGADQAALDVAIELGIPHGGWIPKGRKTEAGRLPDKYHLRETSSLSYPQRTELNVVDSDGTLILTHGKLTGDSALTQNIAKKHRRPCLHVDLRMISEPKAVEIISSWIAVREIQTLNVAGPRASKDPGINDATKRILITVFSPPPTHIVHPFPMTVREAVERLIAELPLKDKTGIANMEEEELYSLHMSLGQYIRDKFGLSAGNEALMESCRFVSKKYGIHYDLDENDASALIIKELWKKLKETHALRVVE